MTAIARAGHRQRHKVAIVSTILSIAVLTASVAGITTFSTPFWEFLREINETAALVLFFFSIVGIVILCRILYTLARYNSFYNPHGLPIPRKLAVIFGMTGWILAPIVGTVAWLIIVVPATTGILQLLAFFSSIAIWTPLLTYTEQVGNWLERGEWKRSRSRGSGVYYAGDNCGDGSGGGGGCGDGGGCCGF